jgi:GTP-binding protein Era
MQSSNVDDGFSVIPAPPEGFRSGFVALMGRPNVGKSTLMNALVGEKVAITSPVAQTTRNRLRGILTTAVAQYIFVDTPGIHKPQHQLGEVLVKNARATIEVVDLVLFVVDGAQPAGRGDEFIAQWLGNSDTPVIMGINKIDLYGNAEGGVAIRKSYEALATPFNWPVLEFSAVTGTGTAVLLERLAAGLEPGPYYYPPDYITDQPERFIMGELVREQILCHTREEVPHSVAVVIDAVKETPKVTQVAATIYVERESQKGILIGKSGQMLKMIGSAARLQMQKLIAGQIYLELFVKVQPKWRQSRFQLDQLGYRLEE